MIYRLHFLSGACLFIYQTLDNMDGKQARKTGSSSPLGMLVVMTIVLSTIHTYPFYIQYVYIM